MNTLHRLATIHHMQNIANCVRWADKQTKKDDILISDLTDILVSMGNDIKISDKEIKGNGLII